MTTDPSRSAPAYRALIVEDDPAIASVVARVLDAAGIDSEHAATGPEGLAAATEGTFGVIVLDILLPGMNGYHVCRELRARGVQTPVLMLTAKTGDYDESDGFDEGADDYLRKPFHTHVLVARVRALLRRGTRPIAPPEIVRGAVAFDVEARRCTVAGSAVELTATESALLRCLMLSGDTPVSREALLDAVWGAGFSGKANIVDVYLGYLRRKLGREQVENVRGSGFRIADTGGHTP